MHRDTYELRVFPWNLQKAADASKQSRHWVMCDSTTAQCYWGKWPEVAAKDKTDIRHSAMVDVVTGAVNCALTIWEDPLIPGQGNSIASVLIFLPDYQRL
jgi:hypothetical protein